MARPRTIRIEFSTDVLVDCLHGGTLDREGAQAAARAFVEACRAQLDKPGIAEALAKFLIDMQTGYGPDGAQVTVQLELVPQPHLTSTYPEHLRDR